jgi:two-component system response regulator AtoC
LLFAVHDARGGESALKASARFLRLAGIDAHGAMVANAGSARDRIAQTVAALACAPPEEGRVEQPLIADAAMMRLYDEARRIAKSSLAVLVVGETGVGKEIFARAIHDTSGRTGPLVCVNAAAIPEQLLESELFGHEKSAFSGATTAKIGLVESAAGGTLFLDEIGELPLSMQAKLLRVLEDRRVRRVGSTVERAVDVRVVAATNSDLEIHVREGRFRRDLLFRLAGSTLSIPPLRERPADVMRLADMFLSRAAAALGAPQLRWAPETLAALEGYAWPGNVRELRNVVDRAAALAVHTGCIIDAACLPPTVREGAPTVPPPDPDDEAVRYSVRRYERQCIIDALHRTGGNKTRAAEMLGLPRRTLAYRMSLLGIGSSDGDVLPATSPIAARARR